MGSTGLLEYWRKYKGLVRSRERVAGLRNWQLRQRPVCMKGRSPSKAGRVDFHILAEDLSIKGLRLGWWMARSLLSDLLAHLIFHGNQGSHDMAFPTWEQLSKLFLSLLGAMQSMYVFRMYIVE